MQLFKKPSFKSVVTLSLPTLTTDTLRNSSKSPSALSLRALPKALGGSPKLISCALLFFVGTQYSQAGTYMFWSENELSRPRFQSPVEACNDLYASVYPHLLYAYRPEKSKYDTTYGNGHVKFDCGANLNQGSFGSFFLSIKTCARDEVFDFSVFSCTPPGLKGFNREVASCSSQREDPDTFAGNPINIISGNKIQREYDFGHEAFSGLQLYRTYNSLDGQWVHNFSSRLEFADDSVILISSDGSSSIFVNDSGAYKSKSNAGLLYNDSVNQEWRYISPEQNQYSFRKDGRLIRYAAAEGSSINLSYQNSATFMSVRVTDDFGKEIRFTEDVKHQLLSANYSGDMVAYNYRYGVLQSNEKTRGSTTTARHYIYDSPSGQGLTGIVDERGIRFATWTYDGSNRATSSVHVGNAGRTDIKYGRGYSEVVNPLGKVAMYNYAKVGDMERIISIAGEPSANCSASNSTYTYNDRAQLLTKTDAKGILTAYTYNDRGLETSRAEASGTSLARVTTTEWDPTRFLPVRIVGPDTITVYSYDLQGKLLDRHLFPR
jgi:YD repeat-containing protein